MMSWEYTVDYDTVSGIPALYLKYASADLNTKWGVRKALFKLMWAAFTMMRPGK